MTTITPTPHPQLSRSEALLPFSPLDTVSNIAFSPDSSIVYVSSWDSTLTIYQLIPRIEPKRGQVAPSFQFISSVVTPAPVTSVLSLSNTCAVIGLVSGQVCLVDITTAPTQPKLSIFYTCTAPVLSIKHNTHHDIVIIIDLSSSLFVFHRLQLTSGLLTLQKPLFAHLVPFLAQHITSNDLGVQIRVPQEQSNGTPDTRAQADLNNFEIHPQSVSPRFPIAMDTIHDFCIIALPHSFDVYQINVASSGILDPAIQTISLLSNTAATNSITQRHQQHGYTTTATTTTTGTAAVSGTALNGYLKSLSISITKFASYHSPITAQLTSLKVLPHTLQVALGTDGTTVVTKRVGFVVGSLEGRAGVDYITISSLPAAEQKQMTQEDEKRRFAFKCHRTILNNGNGTKPEDNVLYAVNAADPHPRAAAFATCGGDGTIVIWSEVLKKRICSFGNKLFPIEHVVFSPNGQYIMWVESPIYNAMDGIEPVLSGVGGESSGTGKKGQNADQNADLKRNMEFGYSNAQNFPPAALPNVMDPIDSVELETIMFEELAASLNDQKQEKHGGSETTSANEANFVAFLNSGNPKEQYHQLYKFYQNRGFQPEQIDRWFSTRTIADQARDMQRQGDGAIQTQQDGSNNNTPGLPPPSNKYRLFARVVSDQMIYPRGSQ